MENNNTIPEGLGPARYFIDFKLIPDMFYGDPNRFLDLCLFDKGYAFAKIFNLVYADYNTTIFAENPKVFKPEDFIVVMDQLEEDILLITVACPEEHEGSLVYCKNYLFLYFPTRGFVLYLTLEGGEMSDNTFLCMVGPDRKRVNYGPINTTDDLRIRITQIVWNIKDSVPIINKLNKDNEEERG